MGESKSGSIFLPILVAILIVGVVGYFAFQNRLERGRARFQPKNDVIEISPSPTPEVLILKIPVLEHEIPGNQYSEATVVGYTDEVIYVGDEFVIDSASLGYTTGKAVGDMKLKLLEIMRKTVVVDVLADERLNGEFYPRDNASIKEIRGTECVGGYPLATDVHYEYCFTFEYVDGQPTLVYTITSESTMPRPILE